MGGELFSGTLEVLSPALNAEGGWVWDERGRFAVGGGVRGIPGCVPEVISELMLESSLAWDSPKLRVSDLPKSEPATCGGRLIWPVL